MAGKIKKIMKEDDIVVFIIKNSKYSSKISQITKILSEMSKKVCYISLNKPYTNLVKMINKLKIAEDKIVVVDCVTKKVTSPKDTKNVVYVSSPQAFTEINITANKVLKKEKVDAVIFDSLSTLLVYGDSSIVIKFVHSIISRFRSVGVKAAFTVLKEDTKSSLLKDLGMFADKVVEI